MVARNNTTAHSAFTSNHIPQRRRWCTCSAADANAPQQPKKQAKQPQDQAKQGVLVIHLAAAVVVVMVMMVVVIVVVVEVEEVEEVEEVVGVVAVVVEGLVEGVEGVAAVVPEAAVAPEAAVIQTVIHSSGHGAHVPRSPVLQRTTAVCVQMGVIASYGPWLCSRYVWLCMEVGACCMLLY